MECTVKWGGQEGMMFIAQTSSGHTAVMDGAIEGGGHNLAPRPMEMLLLGTGGCAAYDVVLILKKARQAIVDCQVKLTATRADTEPKVFTKIHMHFVIKGSDLKTELVERAIQLSKEKYCSASAMLSQTAEITSSYEVVGA